jgi:hypothetical protein
MKSVPPIHAPAGDSRFTAGAKFSERGVLRGLAELLALANGMEPLSPPGRVAS